MALEVGGDEAPVISGSAPERKLAFLDLPPESQREILLHCSQSDLICVALVSKHFHELASSILYRNFHIVFPDDDDLGFDSPIDGLAGGLDTLTTSEYNYAQHLKDIFMDTLSAGVKGEHSYQSYLYSASCGKFLNTLLYLTLKRAKSLEVFRWNIRVELSRPVYKELHRLQSLKRLHIRMQAGESYYSTPPPLPVSADQHTIAPSNHWPQIQPPSPGGGLGFSPTLPPVIPISVPSGPPPSLLAAMNKQSLKSKASRRSMTAREPPTLSGFKHLKSLSVLDIDDLDIIPELKACIANSSSTLSELQLSFSDGLAMQARGPTPDSDPEESDVEEEFQVVPASQNTSYDASGPAKVFRAQEERAIQEGVLGKLLDVEPLLVKKPQMATTNDQRETSAEKDKDMAKEGGDSDIHPRDEFIVSIRQASHKLMSLLNGSRDFTPSQEDILDTIAKAARKYVDSAEAPTPAEGPKHKDSEGTKGGSATEENGKKETATAQDKSASEEKPDSSASNGTISSDAVQEGSGESSSATKRKGNASELSPEDIDIEHTETVEDAFEEDDDQPPPEAETKTTHENPVPDKSGVSDSTTSPKMTPSSSIDGSSSAKETAVQEPSGDTVDQAFLLSTSLKLQDSAASLWENLQMLRSTVTDEDSPQLLKAEQQLVELGRSVAELRNQVRWEDITKNEHADKKKTSDPQNMRDYVRGTRGFSLDSLSIHLVPVKASVLSRAINLSCLKQLTLLNVGNQTPIWTLLAKENKETPLALRSVFTDNVSTAFLSCMSKLPELHELFMLERSAKQKPESFAPRNSTTMDQIRRLVLKKHMHTLRRLMIKDESKGPSWEVNEKAIILMCTRGVELEELAVSMDIHAVHAFMQFFSSLVNLRAIHILHFKNNDTCVWVMREVLKFIVDNLSHNPDLKLEWIAMENDRVDRVVRPSEEAEEPPKKSSKGKDKAPIAPAATGLGFGSDAFPALPLDGLESESESESEDFDSGTRLRFKTMGPLQFYDVWGIKIFEKEIRNGRL